MHLHLVFTLNVANQKPNWATERLGGYQTADLLSARSGKTGAENFTTPLK